MSNPYMHVLVYLFLFAISVYSQTSPDLSSMQALKSSLKLSTDLVWSDPDPCKWTSVTCNNNKQVTRIRIVSKNIQGTLPPDIGNLTSLTMLELMNNQLSGPLPSLAGLGQLQEVNIQSNNFTSIPSDFFSGMSGLQTVSFDNNPYFSPWEIPDSLKDAVGLQQFSANNCNLKGKIPDYFDGKTFASLSILHLAMNNLDGELPITFAGSSITSLWLNSQKLNGNIAFLKNMNSLTDLWLHSNQFTGPIPDVSALTSLKSFSVRDNQLTGIVPLSLIQLPALKTVNLTNNLLQGPTPKFDTKTVDVDMVAGTNSFCLDDVGLNCDAVVMILLSIVEPMGYPSRFAQNWKDNNPCASWAGIACTGTNIAVVNFKGMGLTGTISPQFSNLTSLKTLMLSQNNLTGTIPDSLTNLPQLTTLDVSNNKLSGKIPVFKKGVAVNTEGNVNIGKDIPSPPPPGTPNGNEVTQKSSSGKIVGYVIGVVCGLGFIVFGVYLYTKKRKESGKAQSPAHLLIPAKKFAGQDGVKVTAANNGEGSSSLSRASSAPSDFHVVEPVNMVISIQVLRNVTDNFSEKNILGRGGFGTVYKGELHDGTQIAVKRMESGVLSEKGLAEFKSEITVLTKVRHRHLVGLLGYCLDGNERLLVYEYMPQGTLSRHLFHWNDEGLKPLEWTRRLIIALDVARGVEYLHGLAHQSFIHRDLKPSNILLGDNMRAKVADFGLVRLAPDDKHSIETRLAGTFGYLAPEYAVTGRVTTKVDVFGFGVILMEIITGRRALDESLPEDSMHLVTWFRRMHINKETFRKSIDPMIELDEETLSTVSTVAELAGHCTAREPYQRPEMSHVVNVLSSLVELWKPTETGAEEMNGIIDYDTPLQQVVMRWQAMEGTSHVNDSSSSSSFFPATRDISNTQTSIPTHPTGFGKSFMSTDGR